MTITSFKDTQYKEVVLFVSYWEAMMATGTWHPGEIQIMTKAVLGKVEYEYQLASWLFNPAPPYAWKLLKFNELKMLEPDGGFVIVKTHIPISLKDNDSDN